MISSYIFMLTSHLYLFPEELQARPHILMYLHESTTAVLLTVVESNQEEIHPWVNE